MVKLKQAIAVEGRYDKNTQIVDAPIFVTNGFGIFKDREQMALLRLVAEKRGLIVLTDSDGAGLVIRNRIKSCIPPEYLLHAYIPDVPGKEKRKSAPGKEGKLGVEGMTPEILLAALRNAGAAFLDTEHSDETAVGAHIARPQHAAADPTAGTSIACPPATESAVGAAIGRPHPAQLTPTAETHPTPSAPITKTDLYDLGLSGRPDSREKRLALQRRLGLPENLSANALLTALNCICTRSELQEAVWHPESSIWQSPD